MAAPAEGSGGIGWLVLILGALLWQGASGLSGTVFSEMTPPPGANGGLLNAIVGSLLMTALAMLIGTPLGLLTKSSLSDEPLTSNSAHELRLASSLQERNCEPSVAQ